MENVVRNCVLCLLALFLCGQIYGTTITVAQRSCQYVFTIPEGWDTIPQSTLSSKIGKTSVNAGLFPIQQKAYFDGNYVLISFLPTISSLNNFNLKKIIADVNEMNKSQVFTLSDSLSIELLDTKCISGNGIFNIQTESMVSKDTLCINCLQSLCVTKYGYISIYSYRKENGQYCLQDVNDAIVGSLKVLEEYQYKEPVQKEYFTIEQIVISVGLGLLLYIFLVFINKNKNK
ncbi:hypothetical protein [Phocaeicola sartorii]|uniref:hypothetical protein n=1 Tax=Phocaeicola sartorii TaxID=671267 RepID=UPI003515A8FA